LRKNNAIEPAVNSESVVRLNTAEKTKILARNLTKSMSQEVIESNEESTPLVFALKKLQQKNVKNTGIKMWTNSLADLFYITDVDGNGFIEPDQYKTMIEKLDISTTMKKSLMNKFSEIDVDNIGSITLFEFLYFFLRFPNFNEELLVNDNVPYTLEKGLSYWQLLRLRIYIALECPNNNLVAKILFSLDLILSIVPVVMLSIQALTPSRVLEWGQDIYLWVISIFFAIKYVLGLLTCRNMRLFVQDMWHIIDLVSFLFWIVCNTISTPGSIDPMGFVLFRFLRFARLHKVFNLDAFGEKLDIYTDTLQLAYTSYGAVLGFLSMLIFFFSLLFYAFERGNFLEDEGLWIRNSEEVESPFANLYNCVYFTIVTFTSLGYGDFAPKS